LLCNAHGQIVPALPETCGVVFFGGFVVVTPRQSSPPNLLLSPITERERERERETLLPPFHTYTHTYLLGRRVMVVDTASRGSRRRGRRRRARGGGGGGGGGLREGDVLEGFDEAVEVKPFRLLAAVLAGVERDERVEEGEEGAAGGGGLFKTKWVEVVVVEGGG
jgi:hypothetical protein